MLAVSNITNFKPLKRVGLMNNQIQKTSSLMYQYNLNKDVVSFSSKYEKSDKEILSCSDNSQLAEKLSKESDVDYGSIISKKFKNGETYVKLNDKTDEKSVYILNSGNNPVNDNLMEFYELIDAAKRDGAEKVTAILPYMPYSRQDRLSEDGESLSSKLVAKNIQSAGADKVIAIDLHSTQLQGFFDIPVKNISAIPLFADYFREKGNMKDFIVVSPDVGGVKRAEKLSKELGTDTAIIHKQRAEHNKAKAVAIIGDVKGKNCILVDDMIDTAGTITEAVKMLKNNGAKDVYICATHGIFSDNAFENIKKCPVKEVIVTDTLPLKKGAPDNVKQISVAPIIAEEI